MKKFVCIKIAVAVILTLTTIFPLFGCSNSGEYEAADDEIALRIKLDTKEDIGLLIFDYGANGIEQSGGISNADRSLIKHDDLLIQVWNKDELQCEGDTAKMYIRFRVITEYVEPNFENTYPENLTKYLEPITFDAHFGESYSFTITGDNVNGYILTQNR